MASPHNFAYFNPAKGQPILVKTKLVSIVSRSFSQAGSKHVLLSVPVTVTDMPQYRYLLLPLHPCNLHEGGKLTGCLGTTSLTPVSSLLVLLLCGILGRGDAGRQDNLVRSLSFLLPSEMRETPISSGVSILSPLIVDSDICSTLSQDYYTHQI